MRASNAAGNHADELSANCASCVLFACPMRSSNSSSTVRPSALSSSSATNARSSPSSSSPSSNPFARGPGEALRQLPGELELDVRRVARGPRRHGPLSRRRCRDLPRRTRPPRTRTPVARRSNQTNSRELWGVAEGSRTVETLCRARKCLVDERRHFTSLCRRRGCSDEARMN